MMQDKTKTLKQNIAQMIAECMNSGQKLPSEKEMMLSFNVSRTSLREVLSAYEAQGVIASLQGSGRFVRVPNLSKQLKEMWSILCLAKPSTILELLEIRSILEINSMPQAMQRISVEQLRKMSAQVLLMKDKAANKRPFAEHDREFHRIIFSTPDNLLLEQLLTAFWDLYEEFNYEAYQDDQMKVAIQHEDLLNAFTRQDAAAAETIMREQFTDARFRLIQALMRSGASAPIE